ncbi:hypothetical protein CIK05_07140 [Bdellovibrio sp. qaytius]|nr:hypothetical protein CIK05_07140 [Bdellovibrio sp. qaytius]
MHFNLRKFTAFTESMLLPSIALIPLLKILTLVCKINIPLQYLPAAFLVGICLFRLRKQWATILTINLIVFYYCLIAYNLHQFSIDVSILKNQIAAFVYINSFMVILLKFNSNSIEKEFKTYAKYLVWTSALLISLCYVSLFYGLMTKNLSISWADLQNLVIFNRADTTSRSMFIWLANPVGFILRDYQNMKMTGPQLLINPFLLFLLSNIRADFFKKYQVTAVLIAVLPLFIALNSRALALSLVVIIFIITLKNIKHWLHAVYIFSLGLVPILITTLSTSLLNGRKCQIEFVKNNLTVFGNGIGNKQNELNTLCGDQLGIQYYQAIKSMTYDNVHIEAIHYFGYAPYLLFLIYFIYKGILSNNYQTRLLYTLVFIFFSLNLNLFEIYFVPVLALLATYSFSSRILRK